MTIHQPADTTDRMRTTLTDKPSAYRPLQVLILDDERFDRHRLSRLCSGLKRKTKITTAGTLSAFCATLEERTYDLILLDYMLPDGTGFDALNAVRHSDQNVNAATIMVTGQDTQGLVEQALDSGCADYLTKEELSPTSFRRAVTHAFQKSELNIAIAAETFARAEVEAVLEHFAASFARDIKPMVSRMLRQLRDLREGADAEKFAPIDASCMSIWESLVALERNTGPEIIALSGPGKLNGPPSEQAIKRKPPSPFARMRQ